MEQKYQEVGRYCAEISDVSNREFCFLGVSRMVVAEVLDDMEGALARCAILLPLGGEILCRAGVADIWSDETASRPQAYELCERDLSSEETKFCLEKAHL